MSCDVPSSPSHSSASSASLSREDGRRSPSSSSSSTSLHPSDGGLRVTDFIHTPSDAAQVLSFVAAHSGVPLHMVKVPDDVSGPPCAAKAEMDAGFMCAPALLGSSLFVPIAAPLFAPTRKPMYHSEFVVSTSSSFRCVDDLAGSTVAFNDPVSLSGYHCLKLWLKSHVATTPSSSSSSSSSSSPPTPFFSKALRSGGHLRSLRLIDSGRADTAAIDVTVLNELRVSHPALFSRLRVLPSELSSATYPIQPFVLSRSLLTGDVADRLRSGFLAINDLMEDPEVAATHPVVAAMQRMRYCGFTATDLDAYVPILTTIKDCETLTLAASVEDVRPVDTECLE